MVSDVSFIFQSKPSVYDLAQRLVEGKEVGWIASRYRDAMRVGSVVYLWSAGEKERRGIYGWGQITREVQQDVNGIYRVHVTYRKVFPRPITVDSITTNPQLQEMLVIRNPVGTNFVLTTEEGAAMKELIDQELGAEWSPK